MAVSLGSQGLADFTDPIGLMMDCHRRIEHFLSVIGKVIDRYGTDALDEEGHAALETALNYFRLAAPRHTADEEQSLFPRLRESDDPRAQRVMRDLDRLESDHRRAEAAHARLDELGRRWLADGVVPADALAEFRRLFDELAAGYGKHIPIEDEGVFIVAQRVLGDEALLAVGEEMKRRRMDDPGRVGSRCSERRRRGVASPG